MSLTTAVSTASALCESVVSWSITQLQAIAEGSSDVEGGADSFAGLLDASDSSVAAADRQPWDATLALAEEMLDLAIAQWPVSQHMHDSRVRTVRM